LQQLLPAKAGKESKDGKKAAIHEEAVAVQLPLVKGKAARTK